MAEPENVSITKLITRLWPMKCKIVVHRPSTPQTKEYRLTAPLSLRFKRSHIVPVPFIGILLSYYYTYVHTRVTETLTSIRHLLLRAASTP